jgi:hypothetical protein
MPQPLHDIRKRDFMIDLFRAAFPLVFLVLQAPDTPAARILGTWHGTSICVDRQVDRACGDEEVIYEIDSAAGPSGPVRMRADKVVSGVREPMGELRLQYDSTAHSWSAEFTARLHVRWSFEPQSDVMFGTLRELPSERLMRRVTVRRVPKRESGQPNEHATPPPGRDRRWRLDK